jgi:hypothetical protein
VLCAGFRLYYQGIYERNPNRTIFLDSEIGVKA